MITNVAKIEFKVGERTYQLLCDTNAPTGDVREALSQMLALVTMVENNAKAKAAEADPKPEEKQDEQASSND